MISKEVDEMIYTYYHKYYVPYTKERNAEKAEKLLEKYGKKYSDDELNLIFKKELSPFVNDFAYKFFYKKYYNYFFKAFDYFKGEKNFSGKGFIDSVMADGFKMPQQLSTNSCLLLYRNNRSEFEKTEESEELRLAKSIKATFVYLNNSTISEVLKNPLKIIDFEANYDNDTLDYTVYAFSKAFQDFSKKENFFIDFKSEQNKVSKYPKLLKKIQEKLKDDFIEN